MLGELGGRDNDLSTRYVIVRQEDDLEQVTDVSIAINDLLDSTDQLNDNLGCVVGGGGLTTNHDHSWHELSCSLVYWRILDGQVPMHYIENVKELALILVYTLDLNVVK